MKSLDIILEKNPSDIITDADLVTIFNGTNDQRYGLVKRMIAGDEIIHIRRGLYCLSRKYQRHELNLYALALRVYGPSYVSFESALSYHGWIPEAVYTMTCASMKKSREFKTPIGMFVYKHIPVSDFYNHVERIEASEGNVFFMARPFRALVDYVYIYKKEWNGLDPAVKSLRIDYDFFHTITLGELEALHGMYKSRRVQKFIDGVKKELNLS